MNFNYTCKTSYICIYFFKQLLNLFIMKSSESNFLNLNNRLKYYLTFVFLSFFLLNSMQLFSQNTNQENNFYKTISFGKTIFFGKIEDSAKWKVFDPVSKNEKHLSGNEINNFKFENVGIYEVTFFETKKFGPQECVHPKFQDKMFINVTPVEMVFDFSKITFSDKIQKGQICDGIIISVPVNCKLKCNEVSFKIPDVLITGIDVNLIAKPINEVITIKNGIQFITYKLIGIVKSETYLTFDFVDINDVIQAFYQPEIVK